MPKVVFLAGLCGSGKTRKGKQMERDDGFLWVEGIEHVFPNGEKTNYRTLIAHLKAGRNCVAEELQMLSPGYRIAIGAKLKSEVPGLEVEFWFFAKDLVKATRNVPSRPDDKKRIQDHLFINCNVYHHYIIPHDPAIIILPIEEPTEFVDP